MNHIDPGAPNTLQSSGLDRELTVDEVALIEQANEERQFFPDVIAAIKEKRNLEKVQQQAFAGVSGTRAGLEAQEGIRQNALYANDLQLESQEAKESLELTPTHSEVASDKTAIEIRKITQKVSGRYSNCPRPWKLELRVDVDGLRPGSMVSGDFYYSSGSTTSYFGSLKVEAPTITVSSTQITILGIANTTWTTSYKKVRVVIPRHTIFQPKANAYVNFYTLTNKKGADYTCLYESPYFRTVQLEEDCEEGVTPFTAYNTASLPSGGPNRVLTVAKAYSEAGLQIQSTGGASVVSKSDAGADHKWNNAELHDAMEKHFTLWEDQPGWKSWLFHANAHEYGSGLLGIMYDQKGKQRQGCSSFYQSIKSNSAADLRTQLYVNVHELGHCFNLYHSFHKSYMNPPVPNRPSALSWMNYPQYFPGGASAFWSAFPFQFDDLELAHLRHGFRNDIVMGGNPFGTGAAIGTGLKETFMENIKDQSGLNIAIDAPHFVQLGTPIHVDIAITNVSNVVKQVFEDIHPNNGLVQISLQKPNGKIINYHPPMSQCIMPKMRYLKPGEKLEETSYIGFDAEDGQIFDSPGSYQLFAIYYCPDGSAIRSCLTSINIKSPSTADEEVIADLMLGDQQGMLFFLGGSKSDVLKSGNDAFAEMSDRFKDHPLTNYIQITEGLKASRTFAQIDPEKKIRIQSSNQSESKKLLTKIIGKTSDELGVPSQTLRIAQRCLDNLEESMSTKKEKLLHS